MVQQIRLISLAVTLASTSMQVFFWLGYPLEQEGLTAKTEYSDPTRCRSGKPAIDGITGFLPIEVMTS